jgi:RNA polymerase sigma-70 factor (ECF subfamily)
LIYYQISLEHNTIFDLIAENIYSFGMKRKVNMKDFDDFHLWQAFKRGDIEAFELLYKKYFRILGAYGLRLNSDKNLVEDAIHDVFIELWRRKEFLGDIENVKFYLFSAVRNQNIRNHKKDIFEETEDINTFLDFLSTLSSEQEYIDNETVHRRNLLIHKAMKNLSNRQGEAVHFRFYQGLSLDETSQIMQLPKQVIKNLLSKAYAILRISLKNHISVLIFCLFNC